MTVISVARRIGWLLVASTLIATGPADAQELKVMSSGAFMEAYRQLVPEFERDTQATTVTVSGGSMGNDPNTIPNRLKRGEAADVVILADSALQALIEQGTVVRGSRVELVRSSIGMAVRAGSPKPDIGSIDALTQTLLRARSIAYSSSASGTYLSTELFPRLGLVDRLREKTQVIEREPVGAVVARGDAEIGFQQLSELVTVPGLDVVGPLPPGAQRVTVFSAGIVVGTKEPEAAKALLAFLSSSAAASVIRATGLEPVNAP
jgi:molybdate transport system substrate-binding protein